MDANLKSRMRKVAIVHFSLTVFVVLMMFRFSGGWSGPHEAYLWHVAWAGLWVSVLVTLQPLPLLIFYSFAIVIHHLPEHLFGLWISIDCILALIAIPVWSICFGWIWVKSVNWLNQFPVLGLPVEYFTKPVAQLLSSMIDSVINSAAALRNWAVNHPILGKKIFCY